MKKIMTIIFLLIPIFVFGQDTTAVIEINTSYNSARMLHYWDTDYATTRGGTSNYYDSGVNEYGTVGQYLSDWITRTWLTVKFNMSLDSISVVSVKVLMYSYGADQQDFYISLCATNPYHYSTTGFGDFQGWASGDSSYTTPKLADDVLWDYDANNGFLYKLNAAGIDTVEANISDSVQVMVIAKHDYDGEQASWYNAICMYYPPVCEHKVTWYLYYTKTPMPPTRDRSLTYLNYPRGMKIEPRFLKFKYISRTRKKK